MSLLTFHGFHDEPSTHSYRYNPEYRPSLAVECRRRILATSFCTDNVMVTFTGRPPLLGTSYISTPLPLDVSDDVLFSDEQTLVRVASEMLDERGWGTSGHFHPATMIRARVVLAHIRAEIIELALGKDPFPFERIGYVSLFLMTIRRCAPSLTCRMPDSSEQNRSRLSPSFPKSWSSSFTKFVQPIWTIPKFTNDFSCDLRFL